jgi:hypothetical protein
MHTNDLRRYRGTCIIQCVPNKIYLILYGHVTIQYPRQYRIQLVGDIRLVVLNGDIDPVYLISDARVHIPDMHIDKRHLI